MKKTKDRLVIHWWEDAFGRRTCHLNKHGLSFADSMLGYLEQRLDGWYYYICSTGESVGPFSHTMKAREALEIALNGVQVDQEE